MKNEELEGVRGIAAFGVLLAHLLMSFFPYLTVYQQPGSAVTQFYVWESIVAFPPIMALLGGSFSVSLFFVLSGYVLTKKYYATENVSILQSSAVKRYPRLIIPAAVSVLFAWFLLECGLMNNDKIPYLGGAGWPFGQYSDPVSFWRAVYSGFIGAPIFGDVYLNSPLWTIKVELFGSLFLFSSYALFGAKHIAATLYFSCC